MQVIENLHNLAHDCFTWVTVLLVLGGLASIFVFFKLFQSDFSED